VIGTCRYGRRRSGHNWTGGRPCTSGASGHPCPQHLCEQEHTISHRSATSLRRVGGAAVLVATLTACSESGGGAADGQSSYYAGENVDLVVPYDPGGGYDIYARGLAPYFAECLDANVVVRNEPGAGGLLATNKTAAAGPDERRVQIVNSVGTASAQIAGADGVAFDMAELSVVGRLMSAPDMVSVAADSDIQDFQDVVDSTEPVRFVATGPGSNEYITAVALSSIYGFPLEMVTGFGGTGDARLAVLSGDADAHVTTWDSGLAAVQSGEIKPIVVASDEQVELLPETPVATEFTPEAKESQELLQSLVELQELGRGLFAPPGLPEERLTELREAFECATSNEELISDMETQQRVIDVVTGDEHATQVRNVLDASPEFTAVLKESF
jgi:tripartite-type tricarboxylate transporter receptor subunit TctC